MKMNFVQLVCLSLFKITRINDDINMCGTCLKNIYILIQKM